MHEKWGNTLFSLEKSLGFDKGIYAYKHQIKNVEAAKLVHPELRYNRWFGWYAINPEIKDDYVPLSWEEVSENNQPKKRSDVVEIMRSKDWNSTLDYNVKYDQEEDYDTQFLKKELWVGIKI